MDDMNKSRIERAREAFLRGDKSGSSLAHTKEAIEVSVNHIEGHKTNFSLPEIILGGQDGLVNVLGVILGVAAATNDPRMVAVAGLAATFAESVSMAAVAYTSKIARADYYQSEYEREKWEIENEPLGEREEIRSLYRKYGFRGKTLEEIVRIITGNKDVWLEVMMAQELKLEPVARKEAFRGGVIVGISALAGSFIPLIPFFIFSVGNAIWVSLIISTLVLFVVGYYKAKETLGRQFIKQGVEMAVIGMMSALVGYFVGSLFKI